MEYLCKKLSEGWRQGYRLLDAYLGETFFAHEKIVKTTEFTSY